MLKLSVIVPVYHTEQYLRTCLDSILNQTLKEIEIICIDDCSPDHSRMILSEYERKYPELVRCIYLKENIKQGGARNRGLKEAQGEYVLFVDSDDYIEKDMCEKLYCSAISNRADAVICDYSLEEHKKSIHIPVLNPQLKERNDIPKAALSDAVASCYAWNKLWKRELLERLGAYFPEGMIYEDIAVTYTWLFQAKCINYVNEGLYHYVSRKNSVVHSSSIENWRQFVKAVILLIQNFMDCALYERYQIELTKIVLSLIDGFLETVVFNQVKIEEEDIYVELVDCINENLPCWAGVLEEYPIVPPMRKYILICFLRDKNFRVTILENTARKYEGKNVALWGAGVWGRKILKLLSVHGVVSCFVDSNPAVWGQYLEGLKIVPFEEIQNDCDVIIVAVKNAKTFEMLKETVKKKNSGIEVIHYEELFPKSGETR